MKNVISSVPSISVPLSTNIYLKERLLGDISVFFLLDFIFIFIFFQHLLHYDVRACDRFLMSGWGQILSWWCSFNEHQYNFKTK